MAIVVQYVVVRDGIEKMTFTSKKEADAYDKMLDISEGLQQFFNSASLDINEENIEKLAFYCAEQKDALSTLLKGGKIETKSKTVDKKKNAKKAEQNAVAQH